MNKKIIISFLIIIIVGVFGYFVLSQKSEPIVTEQPILQDLPNTEQIPSPTTIIKNISPQTLQPPLFETPISAIPLSATASWKTYRNDEYGFEFKYPPSFVITVPDIDYSGLYISFEDEIIPSGAREGANFSVLVMNPIKIDWDSGYNIIKYDLTKRMCFYSSEYQKKFYFQEEKINNYSICYSVEGDAGWSSVGYYFIHPTKDIAVGIDSWSDSGGDADFPPIVPDAPIKEILSTFKFTK